MAQHLRSLGPQLGRVVQLETYSVEYLFQGSAPATIGISGKFDFGIGLSVCV